MTTLQRSGPQLNGNPEDTLTALVGQMCVPFLLAKEMITVIRILIMLILILILILLILTIYIYIYICLCKHLADVSKAVLNTDTAGERNIPHHTLVEASYHMGI